MSKNEFVGHEAALCKSGFSEDEDVRKLFSSFRSVFRADSLRERVIFWIEEKYGQAIIRHVVKLKDRTNKSDDKLIGITINSLPAIRIMIGNYADGCNMTTVRWEIYSDFELKNMMQFGRFDHDDLLGDISVEDEKMLSERSVRKNGLWDFDCIVKIHQCPKCGGVFDKRSILYVPVNTCDSCGEKPNYALSQIVVKSLYGSYGKKQQQFTILENRISSEEFPIQQLIDPIANSIVYWYVHCHGLRYVCNEEESEFIRERIIFGELFGRSLYGILRDPYLRKRINKYLIEIDRYSWDVNLSFLMLIGRMIEQGGIKKSEEVLVTPDSLYKGKFLLPCLVNTIILQHKTSNYKTDIKGEL